MKENQYIKLKLYAKCHDFISNRLNHIQRRIQDVEASLRSETKSTAGDKHETGRAMLQLEREKSGAQLAQAQNLQEILAKVPINKSFTNVVLGSLIITNQANYFIAISAGEITVENKKYFAVAANTPIGKLLLGKRVGDAVFFNGKSILIKDLI